MGQLNCSTCTGSDKEKEVKLEVDFRNDILMKKKSQSECTEMQKFSLELGYIKYKTPEVIKIQALWRGYRIRKLLPTRDKISEEFNKNHPEMQPLETVIREEREAFKLKNGAIYTGHWKGQLRDGYGTQV